MATSFLSSLCVRAPLALGVLWLGLVWGTARAQDIVTDDKSQAVAATVLGILGYTRWPTAPQAVRMCVVGPTEYADELLKGGVLPGDRQVQVRRMRLDDGALLSQCDGVYAGMLDDAAWRTLRARLESQPLLSHQRAAGAVPHRLHVLPGRAGQRHHVRDQSGLRGTQRCPCESARAAARAAGQMKHVTSTPLSSVRHGGR